jgi:hypothetical protein
VHQALHVERVETRDVSRHRLLQVAMQRVGVVEHPHLAEAADALVGEHLDDAEVPPRGPEHVRAHPGNLHGLDAR